MAAPYGALLMVTHLCAACQHEYEVRVRLCKCAHVRASLCRTNALTYTLLYTPECLTHVCRHTHACLQVCVRVRRCAHT